MSDDERMDRAERIKQLRQGRRGGGSDDETGDVATDGAEESQKPVEQTESTATESDPDSDATGAESNESADSEPNEGDDALSAAQAAAAAAAEFEGEDVPASGDAGSDATDETEAEGTRESPGAAIAGTEVEETTAEETRVLEFRLGEERYCLDIEYVEEIVREETVTRVPNTPVYVEGVVDLRGRITTILDPTVAADIEAANDDRLIVVFDPDTFDDYGEIGWLVDAVEQVSLIAESDVKEPPMDESYVNGVIERDGEFVIWTTPDLALDVTEEE